MILVITGTEIHPFDRLIQEVDRIAATAGQPIFVQLGHNKLEPKHCEWKRFIGFGEMCEAIEKSQVVITHAGAGSTLLSIQYGKRPIIVPRQKKFGEHIDDHQVVFAQRLGDLDLVRLVEEMSDLEPALVQAQGRDAVGRKLPQARQLMDHLESLLEEWRIEKDSRTVK